MILFPLLVLPVDKVEGGGNFSDQGSRLNAKPTPDRIRVQFLPKNQFLECHNLPFYITIIVVVIV